MRAKYVMTDKGPILFPQSFDHVEFAGFKPTSAGFIDCDDEAYRTHGRSISLGMEPNGMDAYLIEKAFARRL
jgi:hypothetical protein